MQPHSIAGRYRVVRAVGRGGMGTVWLCTDETLHRRVAVKQVGTLAGESADDTARAMREARLAAALNHENAVSIYDVVAHEGTTWLVMEYVPSQTLSQLVAYEGRLPPDRVAHIGAQVAAALSSAHSLGIVHRDVKPGNILVANADAAKISDFGIARNQHDSRLTQTGMVTGTPAFFSPELARGEEASFASDVWALGVTLYTATEGAPPYEYRSNPLAMLSAITREEIPPPTHAGPLTPVLTGMLDRDATRRWTMAQSLAALHEVEERAGDAPAAWAAGRGDGTGGASAPNRPNPTHPLAEPVEPPYEQAVAIPAVSSSWYDRRADAPVPPLDRRSWFARLVLGLLALVVLIGLGALLWNVLGIGGAAHTASTSSNSATGQGSGIRVVTHGKHTGAAGTKTTGTSNTGPASSAAPSSTNPPTSVATTLATSAAPPTTSTPTTQFSSGVPSTGSPGPALSSPAAFTRAYFTTVPTDLDTGWSLIASDMQQRLGRPSYDSFWGSVASVDVSHVQAVGAQTVRYQIVYRFADGSTSTEIKELTLEPANGSYLITSDTTVG